MDKGEHDMKALNIKQVAEKLSLGQSTIYRMIERGEFPKPFNVYSNRTAWLEEDVDAWLAEKAGKLMPAARVIPDFDLTMPAMARA
nr:AlpA family transcriptional regulator [Cupriavidus basilensis]